tara:strand:- start:3170 stop:3610 length:441 start_codon:yes stop_codon:yes gene_type:complete
MNDFTRNVTGAIQGLIDDSKLVDKLCDLLETERINLVKVVTDLDNSANTGIATIEEIKEVTYAVEKANSNINDARYHAEDVRDQAEEAIGYCDEAETRVNDATNITGQWGTKIKELEEVKVEADTEVEKKAPAKKLMNNFQAHNQQ